MTKNHFFFENKPSVTILKIKRKALDTNESEVLSVAGVSFFSLIKIYLKNENYSGILPCFLRGNFTAFVSQILKALISFWRVSAGSITSSTNPLAAAL